MLVYYLRTKCKSIVFAPLVSHGIQYWMKRWHTFHVSKARFVRTFAPDLCLIHRAPKPYTTFWLCQPLGSLLWAPCTDLAPGWDQFNPVTGRVVMFLTYCLIIGVFLICFTLDPRLLHSLPQTEHFGHRHLVLAVTSVEILWCPLISVDKHFISI